ncbi:MAG: helix-turn-helix domain-containing protein [Acidobacteriia bacterium]|nr:helix-turn-helix domain-containing protein [Terriglobia bacterium]
MPVSRLLSVAQVSAKLQCAHSTVRRMVADGELRASRISRRTIRISEADLRAYLDGRANVSVPGAASARINEAAQ